MRNLTQPIPLIIWLCFASISQPAYAQWQNDQNSCKLWVDKPSQTIQWTGQCKNGYASGKGTIEFNSKEVNSCTGEMIQGKLNGQVSCNLINNGSFSGQVKDGEPHGKAVLKLNQKCPKCIQQFSGTYHNGIMAQGTLSLVNGQKAELKYSPDQKGCLVWNNKPSPNEKITWSGECKDGYGHGKGILEFSLNGVTETFSGSLKAGRLNGYGVVSSSGKTICPECIKAVSGTFKNHTLQKGKVTLGNGQIKQYEAQSDTAMLEQAASEMLLNYYVSWQAQSIHNYSLYGQYNPSIFSPYRFEYPTGSVYR